AALQSEAGSDAASFTGYRLVNASPDDAAPMLLDVSPADNALGVAHFSDIVFTLDEVVQIVMGKITLKGTDGAADVVIDVTGGEVTVRENTVTVNPGQLLEIDASYTLAVDAGAFVDEAGNAFAGIVGDTANAFTTAVPPS